MVVDFTFHLEPSLSLLVITNKTQNIGAMKPSLHWNKNPRWYLININTENYNESKWVIQLPKHYCNYLLFTAVLLCLNWWETRVTCGAQGPDWHRPVVELLTGTSPALTFFIHRSLTHIRLEHGFIKESYYRYIFVNKNLFLENTYKLEKSSFAWWHHDVVLRLKKIFKNIDVDSFLPKRSMFYTMYFT